MLKQRLTQSLAMDTMVTDMAVATGMAIMATMDIIKLKLWL